MMTTKVAALKISDKIVFNDKVYVVTGVHQTGLHDLQVYVKSDFDDYETKLSLLAGDKVQLLDHRRRGHEQKEEGKVE